MNNYLINKTILILLIQVLPVTFFGQQHASSKNPNIHIADSGDGTNSNPVMPNAHWSDPSIIKVGNDYYWITSSIDHSPLMQVLYSKDLVNWNIVGSVSRFWPAEFPPVYNWSPRFSYVNKKFRVMGHMSLQSMAIWKSDKPEGTYKQVQHHFTNMAWEWAPTI